MRRLVQVTVPGLFLSLAACGGNVEPKIQLNNDPRMEYQITFRVDDPDVIFDRVEGQANYQVKNEACVPLTPVSGVKVAPSKTIALHARMVDNSTYQLVVFADALRDEDYFGLGVCHWELVAATLIGVKDRSSLSSGVMASNIYSGEPSVLRYPTAWLTAPARNFSEPGYGDAAALNGSASMFTIEARSKEMQK
ncbi:hypothetical protein SAMN02800694_2281 [Luteibacter sp. UNCMF331Sha3.1]|nr:hypothetical protein SAMN02800694_2281 [Luteibacter sp. UNCMF331Sha3.1]